jgi:hypothetical protein
MFVRQADVREPSPFGPDGKLGFFNSDESGRLQAYMIKAL